MTRKAKPLTDTEVKTFKAVDKEVTLFDDGGFELQVKPSGVKYGAFVGYRPLVSVQ